MITLALATEPPMTFSPPQIISVGALHRPLGGENANVSVDLDNATGAFTRLFSDPPFLCEVTLMRDSDTLLRGSLSGVRLGATVQLTVEA